ncbi:MAG: DUF2254 domain-containing protein [Hasllibacter sp.]
MPVLLDNIIPFTRRMWVRIAGIAGLALVALALTSVAGGVLPDWLTDWVGQGAVDKILEVMAGSMLAAIVFTLSVMVTLHRAVAAAWTPRAHRLMVQDNVTLTAVAVFIGGWVYSLAGLALREAGLIGRTESAFLFLTTVLVLSLLVVVLVRWAVHLGSLGSLEETGELVERAAREAIRARSRHPALGASALTDAAAIPAGHRAVRAGVTGWVAAIDVEGLSEACAERGVPVYVTVPPGRFVAAGGVIAMAPPGLDEAVVAAVRLADLRNHEQDPRFGIITLSEIAQKALSPGVNDPGTAIEVVGRLLRTLLDWKPGEAEAPEHPLVFVPPVRPDAMVEEAFAPIARDGRGSVEVLDHVLKALLRLARHPDPAVARAARRLGGVALERARNALEVPAEVEHLERVWHEADAPAVTGAA